MRRVSQSGFDVHLEAALKKSPELAAEYAKQFAELPLSAQLAVMRRRRWLSQQAVAKTLKVKQPHIARVENSDHDPRLSSVLNQAKALHCRLIIVPDELLAKVAQLVAEDRRARYPR